MPWLRLLSPLAAIGLAGCESQGFACANDQQCSVEGIRGQCSAGFCSFPDLDCQSGQRYGDYAGELSGQCVGEPGTMTATTGMTTGITTGITTAVSTTIDGTDDSTTGSEGDGSTEATTSEPECTDGIWCDGRCVDPMADAEYCGASDDCLGAASGEACALSATCQAGACVETCDNCDFETGDFRGWTTVDLTDPYIDLEVVSRATATIPELFTAGPIEGQFFAVTGFDGNGPGTIEIGQDVTVSGVAPSALAFEYRAGWDLLNFDATEDRTLELRIEPPGGGPPLETVTVLVAPAGDLTDDTGLLTAEVDLGAYAGQTIFVNFVFIVPEDYSGPALAQIDDVRLVAR